MYGDKPMFGQYEVKLDEKNRIFIPPMTGREVGDELVLFYDSDINCYKIYNAVIMAKMLEEFENLAVYSTDREKRTKYKEMLKNIVDNIKRQSRIDTQGRIILGSNLKKMFGNEHFLLVGANNHLVLKPKR